MSLNRPIYKLRDWIDPEKLDSHHLSENQNSIDFLEKQHNKIIWSFYQIIEMQFIY